MEQQLGQVLQALATQMEATQQMLQAMQQTQAQQTAALAEIQTRRREPGVVDVSRVGKPDVLKGPGRQELRRQWADWSYTFRTWFCSQWPHGEEILKWASEQYDRQIDVQSL